MCVLLVGNHIYFPSNEQKEFNQVEPHYSTINCRDFLRPREVVRTKGVFKRLKKQSVYFIAKRVPLDFAAVGQELLPKAVGVF